MRFVDYKCWCGTITEKTFADHHTFPLEIKCSNCGGEAKRVYSALAFEVNGHSYKNGYNKNKK